VLNVVTPIIVAVQVISHHLVHRRISMRWTYQADTTKMTMMTAAVSHPMTAAVESVERTKRPHSTHSPDSPQQRSSNRQRKRHSYTDITHTLHHCSLHSPIVINCAALHKHTSTAQDTYTTADQSDIHNYICFVYLDRIIVDNRDESIFILSVFSHSLSLYTHGLCLCLAIPSLTNQTN